MKTIHTYILCVLTCLTVVSCKDDNDEPVDNSVEVSFTTEVQTRALTQVLTTETLETNGASLSLFVAESSTLSTDSEIASYKAIRQNDVWKGSPSIKLDEGEQKYLYAFYPYTSQSENPDALNIEIASQTDYLYSGRGIKVSYTSPTAQLTLNHALPILAFHIKKENYDGNGVLQQITVEGDDFYTAGTIHVVSGNITRTTVGKYTGNCSVTLSADNLQENIPDLFCLPFSSSGSDISVTFKIDGEEYVCTLPKYNIGQGYKYIFQGALTSRGITMFETPQVVSLNDDSDTITQSNHGIFAVTHCNADFTLPTFGGTDLLGSIDWGDGTTESYVSTAQHTYDSEDEKTVTVELWGVEEVSLSTLEGIEEIDLTDF
ncbi:MAG: fimbrillin family protein [Bacteroides sp.]|nr:fimbrillin family protein [Bacteroides sp.]